MRGAVFILWGPIEYSVVDRREDVKKNITIVLFVLGSDSELSLL